MNSNSSTNIVGGYFLVDRFAVGGVAEIFRAVHPESGQIAAVKRLRPDLPFDPEVSGGFLREIQLALLAQHPNLIRGFASGSHDGLDYVVLEFVPGQDMERVVRKVKEAGRTLPLSIGLFMIRELLDGLAFAHLMRDHTGAMLGLVHRDVNPRNVLIGYDGRVKLSDFGAAVATAQEPTPDEIVGSPGYLSPEHARKESIDGRSDLFAVGAMLYEVVAGERAFDVDKKKDSQILKLHQRGEIRPVPDHVDEALRFIIEIACAPDPDERYQSALAMRDAVDSVLDGLHAPDPQAALSVLLADVFAHEIAAQPKPSQN